MEGISKSRIDELIREKEVLVKELKEVIEKNGELVSIHESNSKKQMEELEKENVRLGKELKDSLDNSAEFSSNLEKNFKNRISELEKEREMLMKNLSDSKDRNEEIMNNLEKLPIFSVLSNENEMLRKENRLLLEERKKRIEDFFDSKQVCDGMNVRMLEDAKTRMAKEREADEKERKKLDEFLSLQNKPRIKDKESLKFEGEFEIIEKRKEDKSKTPEKKKRKILEVSKSEPNQGAKLLLKAKEGSIVRKKLF